MLPNRDRKEVDAWAICMCMGDGAAFRQQSASHGDHVWSSDHIRLRAFSARPCRRAGSRGESFNELTTNVVILSRR